MPHEWCDAPDLIALSTLVKLRLRWNTAVYIDQLVYHRIDGDWLITAKGFHIERG